LRRQKRLILILFTAATLGAILWAGFKMPLGVKGEWEAQYAPNPQWLRAWWPLILLAAILWLICWAVKRCENWRPRSERIFLCCFLAALFLFYLSTAVLGEFGAAEVPGAVMWPRAMGNYFKEAKEVGSLRNLPPYLQNFPQRTLRWTSRISTHPPGTTVLFLTFQRAFARSPSLTRAAQGLATLLPKGEAIFAGTKNEAERAESASAFILGLFFILLATASVIPAYLLVREILPPKVAVWALGFCATIPSMHLFSPGIDQTFPLYSLLLSLFILRAIKRKSQGYAFIFGLVFFLALSFTLAFLALAIFFLIAAVFVALKGRSNLRLTPDRWRPTLELVIFALLGFFIPVLILKIALGYNSLSGFYAPFRADRLFYAKWVGRSYWKWLGMNPVMFIIFLGIPAAGLWLSGALKEALKIISGVGRLLRTVNYRIFALTFFMVIVLLIASGRNLGEVERLWAFLMPLAILAALCHWQTADGPGGPPIRDARMGGRQPTVDGFGHDGWLYLLFLQGLQVISFRLLFDVWATAQYYHEVTGI